MRRSGWLAMCAVMAIVVSCVPDGGEPPSTTTTTTSTTTSTTSTTTTSTTTTTVPTSIQAKAIASGDTFSCAIRYDDSVRCWGYNASGRLGDGTTIDRLSPVDVVGLGPASAIALGDNHACAIVADGAVKCWGANLNGQLGDGTNTASSVPVDVVGITGATQISAGSYTTCVIVADGAIKCWGVNYRGQLGNNTFVPSNVPVDVVGITGATSVDTMLELTCAVVGGAVKCWGGNEHGILGWFDIWPSPVSSRSVPVDIPGLGSGGAQVALAYGTACVRMIDQTVKCWGTDSSPSFARGDGSVDSSAQPPTTVSGLTDATAISGGRWTFCALRTAGDLSCWGNNQYGQYGNGTVGPASSQRQPVVVPGMTTATSIALGTETTCVTRSLGAPQCWGSGARGQIGDGTTVGTPRLAPTDVIDVVPGYPPPTTTTTTTTLVPSATITQLAVGGKHSCVLKSDDKVRCWGENFDGQIGNGNTVDQPAPVDVPGLTGVTNLGLGGRHSCAVVAGGAVKCWGENLDGQLGNGANSQVITPVFVSGLTGATQVVGGDKSTCAIVAAGAVKCWGDNIFGGLGNNSQVDSNVPVDVVGLTGVTQLSSSGLRWCALVAGDVKCWGGNQGYAIGVPDPLVPRLVPTDVPGMTSVLAIATSTYTGCGLIADGTVRCFGGDSNGTRGDGPTSAGGLTVTNVDGLSDAVEVSGRDFSFCARRATGSVVCWGFNVAGKYGDGTTTSQQSPVATLYLSNASSIRVGDDFVCAERTTGAPQCWGTGDNGQIGDGNPSTVKRLVPHDVVNP